MNEATFTYDGDVESPRFRAKNQPIRLRWGDDGKVEAKIGEVLFQNVFWVSQPDRGFAKLWVVEAKGKKVRTFRTPEAAFDYWLSVCEPVYCDNDDCVRLPDGRVFDMQ